MEKLIHRNQLPIVELEKLGLYQDGKLLLKKDDLEAMLAGRRSDFVTLKNLGQDGYQIKQIDVKLSLDQSEEGKINLKLHPIHRVAQDVNYLSPQEAELLKSGQLDHLEKMVVNEKGEKDSLLIEYDPETREFVTLNSNNITAPNSVNGEALTSTQQDRYKKGKVVELSDGTQFRLSAKSKKGVLSNRAALLFSILFDGGLSYLLVKGLQNFENRQSKEYSKGYEAAVKEFELQRNKQLKENHEIVNQRVRIR